MADRWESRVNEGIARLAVADFMQLVVNFSGNKHIWSLKDRNPRQNPCRASGLSKRLTLQKCLVTTRLQLPSIPENLERNGALELSLEKICAAANAFRHGMRSTNSNSNSNTILQGFMETRGYCST